MDNNHATIKLPMSLGLKINKILKTKIQFTPRTNNLGIMSFEFTINELALIDKLIFENPVTGDLDGIELLPNLKSLRIKSNGNSYYKQDKKIASISDKDGLCISKCKNLEVLEIENQAKISFLDVSDLNKLRVISLYRNMSLDEIYGLDKITTLWQFDCVGNESFVQIKDLDKIIINNIELTNINLDILLFPDAVGYGVNSEYNESIMEKLNELNFSWEEILSNEKNIKINTHQMLAMHKKACEALQEYVPQYCEKRTIVVGIEQYLSENVKYDNGASTHNHSYVSSPSNQLPSIVTGPLGGANGAYNAFLFNTCVCEGYTRAMQYMLKLRGIKSHNVHCISGEDKLHMATDKGDDRYKIYDLPDNGYHSIISIDDLDYLYDDPCWNAGRYQKGDKSMPWILLTKEEISKDHTLSFGEKNINNNTFSIDRNLIEIAKKQIELHRETRSVLNQQNSSKDYFDESSIENDYISKHR